MAPSLFLGRNLEKGSLYVVLNGCQPIWFWFEIRKWVLTFWHYIQCVSFSYAYGMKTNWQTLFGQTKTVAIKNPKAFPANILEANIYIQVYFKVTCKWCKWSKSLSYSPCNVTSEMCYWYLELGLTISLS